MKRILLIGLCGGLLGLALAQEKPTRSWYRGNTHTHTLWSDGDAAPEWAVKEFVDRDYDFLVLSDHNILSRGEKWFPIGEGRLTPARVEELVAVFGAAEVELREGLEPAMRLKTLEELRARFCADGDFLLIEGEEVTDSWQGKEIHINALNIDALVPPQGGDSVAATIRRNMEAIQAEGKRSGREVLAHLNHPNFVWSLTVEDVAAMPHERFFEVYNGHHAVRNYGDAEHPGMEELWDRALVLRLEELDLGLLYGVATDDSHNYFRWGERTSNPGRGWVVVRAEELEADAIVRAMKAGDFYASTGVELRDFRSDGTSMTVEIAQKHGETYTTQFFGSLRERENGEVGVLLAETTENPARYEFGGAELYVRARVVSSADHPNPYAAGDKETAWVQPVLVSEK